MEMLIPFFVMVFAVITVLYIPTEIWLIFAKPLNWLLQKIGVQEAPHITMGIGQGIASLINTEARVKSGFGEASQSVEGVVAARGTEWKGRLVEGKGPLSEGEIVLIVGVEGQVLLLRSNR